VKAFAAKALPALLALTFMAASASSAAAQDTMQDMDMPSMQHAHVKEKQTKHDHAASVPPNAPDQAMHGMKMLHAPRAAQPEDGRSGDYSDGYTYGPMAGMDMHDDAPQGMLLLDQLEYVHSRGSGNATAIDGEAWYGGDIDKLWLKFEGQSGDALRTEALWSRATTPFWDTQLGVRHDSGVGPGRTWAAFGVEGLAPYWFETEATFYVGQGGRVAARVQAAYNARLTQRLILQPEFEANFYGRSDPRRGIGSGLSDAEFGLRLRYEIRREFAPYLGVVWQQRFGRTADFARGRGERADDLQFVAGMRVWF